MIDWCAISRQTRVSVLSVLSVAAPEFPKTRISKGIRLVSITPLILPWEPIPASSGSRWNVNTWKEPDGTIAANSFFFKKLSGEQPKIVPWNRSLSPRHFHCLEIIRCKTPEFRLCLSEHFVYLRFSSGVEPKNAGFRSEICLRSAIPEGSLISIAFATSTSVLLL